MSLSSEAADLEDGAEGDTAQRDNLITTSAPTKLSEALKPCHCEERTFSDVAISS